MPAAHHDEPAQPAIPHTIVPQSTRANSPPDVGNPDEKRHGEPFLVRILKDDELSSFEQRTVTFGKWGFFVAALSLLAACVAALFVFQQFQEMAAQTELLSRSAQQARLEAKNSSIVAASQLLIAQQQVKAAQDSAMAIQSQTLQQERPWIAVDVGTPSSFIFDEDSGGVISMGITLKNIGHSVAEDVTVWTALEMDEEWRPAQKRICEMPTAPESTMSDYGYLLFPAQTTNDVIHAIATGKDAKKALRTSPFPGKGLVTLNIVICVDYKSVLDAKHHQTRRLLGVTWIDPAGGGRSMGVFEPKRKYADILLGPRLHGDSAD